MKEPTWEEIYKKYGKPKKRKQHKPLIIAGLIIIIIGALFYFTVISPLVSKPYIEKPGIAYTNGEAEINETHIAWIMNELGSYKLSEDAEIQITSGGKTYTVTISDNFPVVQEGSATDSDIVISTQDQYIAELFEADDIYAKANEIYDEGKLDIEVMKPQQDLLIKGYLSIYNHMTGSFFLL